MLNNGTDKAQLVLKRKRLMRELTYLQGESCRGDWEGDDAVGLAERLDEVRIALTKIELELGKPDDVKETEDRMKGLLSKFKQRSASTKGRDITEADMSDLLDVMDGLKDVVSKRDEVSSDEVSSKEVVSEDSKRTAMLIIDMLKSGSSAPSSDDCEEHKERVLTLMLAMVLLEMENREVIGKSLHLGVEILGISVEFGRNTL